MQQKIHPKIQKNELYKIRKHKDLSFLLDVKTQNLNDYITKYFLTEGVGNIMNQFSVPITLYYSYQKYDYTGKFISRTQNKSHNFPLLPKQKDNEQNNIAIAASSMKLNQKAWFNIQMKQKYQKQALEFPGFHYHITLDKFVYKNDDKFQSKKLLYEENRQKAKALFQKKNYREALKIYKHSINILTGLSKKTYNQAEMKQLREYCLKTQQNFLKCLGKMNGFGGRYDKQISKQAKQILERLTRKNPESINSLYQKAIYLKYECRFHDAQEAILQAFKKNFSEDPKEATSQKTALKNMLDEIKNSKERNLRHLRRQEIRKRKAEKKNREVWTDKKEDQTWEQTQI